MTFNFCPGCGGPLLKKSEDTSHRTYCAACERTFYRNPTVGVAVVLVEQDNILLVKRLGSYAGSWCIPCGHVEWGEEIRMAARREFREETGLTVSIGPVVAAYSNFHDMDKQTAGIWFWGNRAHGTLAAGSDASDTRFFPLNDLPDNMAFPTDLLVCEKIRRGVETGSLNQWLASAKEMEMNLLSPPRPQVKNSRPSI